MGFESAGRKAPLEADAAQEDYEAIGLSFHRLNVEEGVNNRDICGYEVCGDGGMATDVYA